MLDDSLEDEIDIDMPATKVSSVILSLKNILFIKLSNNNGVQERKIMTKKIKQLSR